MHRLRPRFVLAILAALTGAVALAAMLWPAVPPVPRPLVHVALVDPYAQPPLEAYGAVQLAQRTGDRDALRVLADDAEGFLAFRLALWLAGDPELPASERLGWYERVLELRIDDPLERAARRALHAEVGAVAEAAGYVPRAIAAYREALPNQAAIEGLERLEPDPYRLANAFLQARMSTRALAALDGRAAPSIEAPALRAVGRHEAALDAFRRWLVEVPGSPEALEGIAWSLFSLERWREADAAFATVGGATGTHGRGLVAAREGRITDAVALMMATGRPSHMWLATGWLETRDRVREAIDAYLRIAALGDAVYADDAAYRAMVLARRLGDEATAAQAEAAIPDGSFFALRLGRPLDVPRGPTPAGDPLAASATTREALDLARALMIVGDPAAARGELTFALRAATEREDAILLAEGLQRIGEFRQSQRAAQAWLNAGDRDPRVWRLAYPMAYPDSTLVHAASFDLEPALVWAVMRQESAFSPVAVSTSNAQGLMQVIPSTWDWLAELQRERPGDPFDPDTNVRYGSYYLRWLLNYFGGDVELAIASYNRGQGYIRRLFEGELVAADKDDLFRHIDALETREYLQRVTLHLETYRALYGDDERLALTP
jgi:soluble lytic murein transglycosylase